MGSTENSLKDKYWNDQIKSMMGPCLITFAIPITIPGVTITLVAFSEERALPKYGALHVTGLILLILAVTLILVGCVLKYVWKPFIPLDIERQLTPYSSFRNSAGSRQKLDGIYRDKQKQDSKGPSQTPEEIRDSPRISQESHITKTKNPIEQGRTSDTQSVNTEFRASSQSTEAPSCSGVSSTHNNCKSLDSKRSDDVDLDKCDDDEEFDYIPHEVNDVISNLPPSTSRHLPPISPRGTQNGTEAPSLSEIQSWRKKKKKQKTRKSLTVCSDLDEEDGGVVNQGSDYDDNDTSSAVRHELTVDQDSVSGGSGRSSHKSLLSGESTDVMKKKQKRRKKKRKKLTSLKQASLENQNKTTEVKDDVETVKAKDSGSDTDYNRPLNTSVTEYKHGHADDD